MRTDNFTIRVLLLHGWKNVRKLALLRSGHVEVYEKQQLRSGLLHL